MMDAAGFISSRMRMKSRVATVCVAVSFLVMIVAVAVSGGFRNEIRSGISAVSGDVQLLPLDGNSLGGSSPIGSSPAYLEKLNGLPSVESVVPVVYRAGIVKVSEDIHGVMFKGVHSDTSSLTAAIPRKLATLLKIGVGDDLPAYFVGGNVKVRKFRVGEIYDGLLDSADKLVVLVPMGDLQRVNGWTEDEVSAFEIKLRPSWQTSAGMMLAEQEIGFTVNSYAGENDKAVYASSAVSRYPQLFDWLNLIDFNVLFILALMTVVAGFNMISGLLIMLFENIPTIGVLKALGMRDRSIGKVFLTSASRTVLTGMLAGNIVAGVLCLLQWLTHIVPLDPENYFVSFVPIHVSPVDVLLADTAAYAVIMLLLLVPTIFISRVDPARTVKAD